MSQFAKLKDLHVVGICFRYATAGSYSFHPLIYDVG
jgi:hypothetical protein